MRPIEQSLKEYGRGIVGGLLFSLPLLYTMEVWWKGMNGIPAALLAYVVFIFILLLGYNWFVGIRKDPDWKHVFIDSVEELGISFILAFGILLVLGRIQLGSMGMEEVINRTVIEAMGVAIGISVGTAQLGGGKKENKGTEEDKNTGGSRTLARYAILSLCGAVLVGSNVAPTEEIIMLGMELSPLQVLSLALISILLTISIIFFMNFHGGRELPDKNRMMAIASTGCISFTVSLAVSAFMLWFFDRYENTGFYNCVAMTVVLGFATSLGASAGRLLLK